MKIAIISPIFPNKSNRISGIFVRQQAKYLAREGNDVLVLTTGSDKDREKEILDGVEVRRLSNSYLSPISSAAFSVKCVKMIKLLSRQSKIDVVIQNFIGISTIILGFFLKLQNKKFIVISHGSGWELPKKNIFKNLIIRFALAMPDKIICVSNKTKELLSKNTHKENLIVINNGMDPEEMVPTANSKILREKLGIKNKIVILSVCNLVPKKGIDSALLAFSESLKTNSNLTYLIIGDGPEKEHLISLSINLGISKNVMFLGEQTGAELANYYSLCDIFIMPSRDVPNGIESFGIAFIEASYFAKPIIAGKSGGTEDAVLNKKTGFIIDSRDSKKLVETLNLLVKDRKLRKKLGNYGSKRVMSGFLWKHNAEKLLKEIKSI